MRRLRPGVGIGRFPRLIVEVFFSRTQTGSRLDKRLSTTEDTEKSTAKPRIPRRKRVGQGKFMHLMPRHGYDRNSIVTSIALSCFSHSDVREGRWLGGPRL